MLILPESDSTKRCKDFFTKSWMSCPKTMSILMMTAMMVMIGCGTLCIELICYSLEAKCLICVYIATSVHFDPRTSVSVNTFTPFVIGVFFAQKIPQIIAIPCTTLLKHYLLIRYSFPWFFIQVFDIHFNILNTWTFPLTNQLIICKGDTSPKWLVIYRPPGHVCGQFSRSMIDTLFKVFPAANKSFPPSLASCLAKASGASELSANINANVNVNRTVYKYKYKYKYLYAINVCLAKASGASELFA